MLGLPFSPRLRRLPHATSYAIPITTIRPSKANRRKLRDILGVPIPRVHAWSCEASNPVGAEYIIEEKAPGIPLGHVWNQITKATQLRIIDQIVDIEKKYISVHFPRHGCIYYRADLERRSQHCIPLDDLSIDNALTTSSDSPLSSFALGPVNGTDFWGNERATMELDRGPCTAPSRTMGLRMVTDCSRANHH